jgi:hypothetical protein
VGWLVLFGRKYADGYRDVSSIVDMAVELVIEELSKLGTREKIVLEAARVTVDLGVKYVDL